MSATVRGFLVAATLVCMPASAAPDAFANADALGHWITCDCAKPEPWRVDEALDSASSKGFMRDGRNALLPTTLERYGRRVSEGTLVRVVAVR